MIAKPKAPPLVAGESSHSQDTGTNQDSSVQNNRPSDLKNVVANSEGSFKDEASELSQSQNTEAMPSPDQADRPGVDFVLLRNSHRPYIHKPTNTSLPRLKLQSKKRVLWALIILIALVILVMNKDNISNISSQRFLMENYKSEIDTDLLWKDVKTDGEKTESSAQKKIQAWFVRRKQLQEDPAEKKKLLLFCYMRGGSTFFGEFFKANLEAYFWYEPLDSFYMYIYGLNRWTFTQDIFWHQHSENNFTLRTQYPEWELEAVSNFNRDLLTCNFTNLPIELLNLLQCVKEKTNDSAKAQSCDLLKNLPDKVVHKCERNIAESMSNNCSSLVKQGREVVASGGRNGSADVPQEFVDLALCEVNYRRLFVETGCQEDFTKMYKTSKLVVYKGLRHMMNSMEHLLHKTPDMFIIYLIRDPRAIVSSRFVVRLNFHGSNKDPVLESKFLCAKILNDYLVYKMLNTKYPGVIKLVKYEELVKDNYGLLDDMYSFLGMDVPESVIQNVKNLEKEHADKNSTLEKWRVNNSKEVQRGMTDNCRTCLETLGYEL